MMRKSPSCSRGGDAAAGSTAVAPGAAGGAFPGARSSIITRAENRSRMSPSYSGYLSVYSLKAGRSPRRKRSMNSSPSFPTNASRSWDSAMSFLTLMEMMTDAGSRAGRSFKEPRHRFENCLQTPERAHVARCRAGCGHPQDVRRLLIAELFKVPQGEDLAVDRVEAVDGFLQAKLPFGPDG